ncbi:MAG: hypothetical protein RI885_1286 [Actinomycetota bacterium]|jgi:2-oxo-4-hydroxy-4-carboxy-5-ureidoimidazoline decarboxylase
MRTVTDAELRDGLRAALGIRRWVDEVVAAGPFDDLATLLSSASHAARSLTDAEIDEAMAHHPRIGEKPVGAGAAQEFSRAEQGSIISDAAQDDAAVATAIAAGNAAYEQRFGRVFLIRAAGRSRSEILAELSRRLQLDEASELAIVAEQLRQIALLRLESRFGGTAAGSNAISTSTSTSTPTQGTSP